MPVKRKKTPPKSISPDPVTQYALDVRDGKEIVGPLVRLACERHLRDVDEQEQRGIRWDWPAAKRALDFFPDVLRLAGGEHEGRPFKLHPSQVFIVGSLFGWKGQDGHRRFRVCYIEQGKGNGKSPLAAGVGLYMLTADKEPRAEVYAAATDKDQAKILFRDAIAMVDQSKALNSRLTRSGGAGKEWNLAYLETGSFFRPISSEHVGGRGKSGFRPHCALLDEVHEHPSSVMVEMMRAGTKGRRQALIFMITNAGVYDPNSVAFHYHDYAEKVLNGHVENDSFFAYVCALDNKHQEQLHVDVALRHMVRCCTCQDNKAVKRGAEITLIDSLLSDPSVMSVIEAGGSRVTLRTGKPVRTTSTGVLTVEDFADRAMNHGRWQIILDEEKHRAARGKNTNAQIGRRSAPTVGHGLSDKGQDTDNGKQKSSARENSGYRQNDLSKYSTFKMAVAACVEGELNLSSLTTAMTQGMPADSSATTATLDSVFSGIISRLFNEHSPICKIRQRYEVKAGRLYLNHPGDDWKDPGVWKKTNPLLGISISEKYLQEQVREASGMPSKQSLVRRLNFCEWVESADPFVDPEVWRANGAEPGSLEGKSCYGGLDLSGKNDLTALVLLFPMEDCKPVLPFFWTPEEGLRERASQDRAPYDLWAEQGYISAKDGATVDYGWVAQTLGELSKKYRIEAVAFDRWRIDDLQRELDAIGVDIKLVEHGQGFKDMSPAVEALEDDLKEGRLRHGNHPVLGWCVSNAKVTTDPAGLRKFDKRKATGRIDGAVALAMAANLSMYLPAQQEPQFFVI